MAANKAGRDWTTEEDDVLRDCYSSEPYPALAAFARLPHRSYDVIRRHAMLLNITDRHRKTKPLPTVVHADLTPAIPHPKGWIRPVICPHCREVITVPADPRAD